MTQIINDERYKRGYRPHTKPVIPEQSDESGVDGVEVKKVTTGTLANGAATNQQQQVNNASTQTTNQQNNNTSPQTAQTTTATPGNTQAGAEQTTTATPVVPVTNTPSIEKTTTVDVTPEKIVYNATEAPSDKEIAKTSENLVTYDDGRNAVRDFGRYVKYNSYGDSYDWEQIQNSMKPDDIIAFQKAHGLPQTGIIGKKTYALLKSEWDKQQLYEEQLGNNLANALKPNAEDGNKGKNYLIKETITTELKDWIDRYGNAEPTDFADGAVSELQTILKELGKTNPRIQEILVDDKFGEQTMTTFMQALFTDSDLQAALGLRDTNGKKNVKAYSHIMDMLRNDGGDEHAEYVRNYALRQQERNKKFQTLGEIVGLIRDGLVASGGVDPGKRDNSAKFQSIQKYADEANKNYRDYIAERNKTILGMEKASEDVSIKQDETQKAMEHDMAKQDKTIEAQERLADKNNAAAKERTSMQVDASIKNAQMADDTKRKLGELSANVELAKNQNNNKAKIAVQLAKQEADKKKSDGTSFASSLNLGYGIDCVDEGDVLSRLAHHNVELAVGSSGKFKNLTKENKIAVINETLRKLQHSDKEEDRARYGRIIEDLVAQSNANKIEIEAAKQAYLDIFGIDTSDDNKTISLDDDESDPLD